jgi:hypothetical protein
LDFKGNYTPKLDELKKKLSGNEFTTLSIELVNNSNAVQRLYEEVGSPLLQWQQW